MESYWTSTKSRSSYLANKGRRYGSYWSGSKNLFIKLRSILTLHNHKCSIKKQRGGGHRVPFTARIMHEKRYTTVMRNQGGLNQRNVYIELNRNGKTLQSESQSRKPSRPIGIRQITALAFIKNGEKVDILKGCIKYLKSVGNSILQIICG